MAARPTAIQPDPPPDEERRRLLARMLMQPDATRTVPGGGGRPDRPVADIGRALMELVTRDVAPGLRPDPNLPRSPIPGVDRALNAAGRGLRAAGGWVQDKLAIPDDAVARGRALMSLAGTGLDAIEGPAAAMAGPLRAGKAGLTKDVTRAFGRDVKERLGLEVFDVNLNHQGDIVLNMLAVPKGSRKQGVGTAAMEELTRFADENGKRIVLSAGQRDPSFGTTSQSRLFDFYGRQGFVRNRGRKTDYAISENMYRDPRGAAPLSMDTPSRMARAKAMGFDVDAPLYHGTDKDFAAFDLGKTGTATDTGFYGKGIYAAPDPDAASNYAMDWKLTDDVESGRRTAGDWPEPSLRESPRGYSYKEYDEGTGIPRLGGNVKPVVARGKFMDVELHSVHSKELARIADEIGFAPKSFVGITPQERDKFYDALRAAGYDGLNLRVDGGLHERLILDPKNIRSKFAKFDPSKSDSADLLASATPFALGAGLMGLAAQKRKQRKTY
jgi:GNAT superfamily N-acetyltransferase